MSDERPVLTPNHTAIAVHQLVPLHSVDSGKDSFILGPTPAQIKSGRAEMEEQSNSLPDSSDSSGGGGGMRGFFRKATRADGMQEVLERVNFKQKFSSLPQFNPGVSPSSMPTLPASPQVSELPYLFQKTSLMFQSFPVLIQMGRPSDVLQWYNTRTLPGLRPELPQEEEGGHPLRSLGLPCDGPAVRSGRGRRGGRQPGF